MKNKICLYIKMHKIAIFGATLLFLSAIIFFRLFFSMDLYSDDYYYGTFFKDGLSSFFIQMKIHFQQNNGRTLVHTLACVILACGNMFSAFFMTIFLFLIPVVYCKTTGKRLVKTLFVTAFFGFFLMTVSPLILKESLFWTAGYFNYVFPFLCLILAMYLQDQIRKAKKTRTIVLFSLFQLVLGATNEQPSAATAFATAFLALCYIIEERKWNMKYLIAPAMNTLGFASIFLSPGTLSRLHGETETAHFIYRTGLHIAEVGKLFLMEGAFTLSILFFVFVSFYPLIAKKGNKLLLLGLPMGLGFILLRQAATRRLYVFIAFAILGLYLLLAALVMAICDRKYADSALLLAGLFSVFVISLTATIGPRVAICLIFSMGLVLSRIVYEMLCVLAVRLRASFCIQFVGSLLLASYCLILAVPTIRGYLKNETIRDENIAAVESARKTGILDYNMDLDITCSHTPIFRDGYCYNVFVDYYDLQNTKIFFKSSIYPAIYANGERLPFVAVSEGDRVFFPIERIVAAFGGQTAWSREKTDIQLFDRGFSLVGDLLYEEEYAFDVTGRVRRNYYCLMFSDDILRDVFGFTIRYDELLHSYAISYE